MKLTVEQRLINARPETQTGDQAFVVRTMVALKTASAHETFERVLRKTSTTKQERLIMKLKSLPRTALITMAIVATGSTTALAYAGYQWLVPKISILHSIASNDDQKREYSVNIQNCGVVVGGTPIGNGVRNFELAKNSKLSQAEVLKVLKNTCTFQALTEFSQKHWKNDDLRHVKKDQTVTTYGNAGPEADSGIGKVTAISPTSITISTKIYTENPPQSATTSTKPEDFEKLVRHYPNGKTISNTYPLASDAQAWDNNAPASIDHIKPGDTVSLVSRDQYVAQADDDLTTGFQEAADKVVAVIKTNLDPAYTQMFSIGDPRLAGPVFELVGCQHQHGYICLSKNSPFGHNETVYASQPADIVSDNKIENGAPYFRKDISQKDGDVYYQLEGRITSLHDKTLTFRTRGKVDIIKVNLPYDVLAAYNKNNKTQVKVGDFIELNYAQKTGENHMQIKAGDITSLSLAEYQLPDGSYVKY